MYADCKHNNQTRRPICLNPHSRTVIIIRFLFFGLIFYEMFHTSRNASFVLFSLTICPSCESSLFSLFSSFFFFVGFKIDVLFRSRTSRARYQFHDRRSERGHVAAEFALSSPFLRVGDYFGTITLFRGLSDTDGATIPRQTLRGRDGDPESFSSRPVPWQRTYDLHRSDIYIHVKRVRHEEERIVERESERKNGREREWHEEWKNNRKERTGAHIAEAFSRCLTTSSRGTHVKSRSSETFFWYFLSFGGDITFIFYALLYHSGRQSCHSRPLLFLFYIYCTLYFQNFTWIIIFSQYT